MENKERLEMLINNAVINRDNYNSNKITKEQYFVRKSDVNNRITELKKEIRS